MPLELWLAVRLLLARPRQTTLSVLGVVVGVAALIIMRSMTLGFLNQFVAKMVEVVAHVEVVSEEMSAYFQPTGTDATQPLRQALQGSFLPTLFVPTRPAEPRSRKGIADWEGVARRIRRLPQVVAVAPVVVLEGLVVFNERMETIGLIGIEPALYEQVVNLRRWMVAGDLTALQRNPNSLLLGVKLAEELGVRVGDRVTVVGRNGRTTIFRVVGLFASKATLVDRFRGYGPLRTVQRLKDTERVDVLSVRLTDLYAAERIAERISQVTGLEAQSWQTMSRSVLAIFRMIDTITTLVVIIIVVVAGFGIAITLILLVSEKRGTIGVLKAAGMTPQRIALSFLGAGLFIAGAGILLGELVGWLGVEILDRTPTGLRGFATFVESETFPMLKRWDIFGLAAGAAFVVVLCASWFPARRAARLDPVAILRGE